MDRLDTELSSRMEARMYPTVETMINVALKPFQLAAEFNQFVLQTNMAFDMNRERHMDTNVQFIKKTGSLSERIDDLNLHLSETNVKFDKNLKDDIMSVRQ